MAGPATTALEFFENMGKQPGQFNDADLRAVQIAIDQGIDQRTLQNVWLTSGADGVVGITINPELAAGFGASLGTIPADFVGFPDNDKDRTNLLDQGFIEAPAGFTLNGEALPEGAFVLSFQDQQTALAAEAKAADLLAVSSNANEDVKAQLSALGLGYRGDNASGNFIAVAPDGKEFIYGLNEDGSIFRIGKAGSDGVGGSGGGGAARVNLQNIGVDKDGFALVFNPATGSITKGPQVGFGQIDPRIIAAEEARQFNEGQSLKEGEFLRDVLSSGRNFLTAALLTRGGRSGFTTGLTQSDILAAGGVDQFGGASQSLGGLNQALGFLNPEDRAKVPGFVLDGLADQGAIDPGAAVGFAPTGDGRPAPGSGPGLVREGEVDPTTLAPFGGSNFGSSSRFAVGDKPSTKTSASSSNLAQAGSLGAQALAFAPPAVKDIAAGKEVGGLSTPGSIPLSNPQTLANLTKDEKGALDTTLQNVDQRTFGEFEQESNQRFRGQGSRLGVRSR